MATDRGNTDRGNNGRFTRTLEGARRDAAACEMRTRGATYQQIADALGYGDRSHAHRAVQAALAALPADSAEDLRRMQLEQLDYLTAQTVAILERDHPTVSQGGRIVLDEQNQAVTDDGPALQAINLLLRIQDRRAKLKGLDAPTRAEVVTLDAINAEIARIAAELGLDQASEAEGTAGT